MAKPALGRGLGALLGGAPIAKPQSPAAAIPASAGAAAVEARERIQRVPLDRVQPCAFQPRKEFSAESLRELADSIREQGIVQPLVVRERNGHFELIAGERRWRAARLAGLAEVPIILRTADDRAVLELALIENLQRENLNPVEEAQGYAQLIQQFELTQEDVAVKVGKSRAAVANSLRLLKLPAEAQSLLREGRLSAGHAKVILGLPQEGQQKLAVQRVIMDGLNVRQTEELVSRMLAPDAPAVQPRAAIPRDSNVSDIESRLREKLGTKVRLRYAQGKGAVEIVFFSDDELQRVLDCLGVGSD
ncbi:MAG TPA: ParB/RepB/Spo0J family partition protein [Verrucomicrobiae bacterium]|nr:ParB/RepB/Spo0J family partition protein [Verrucomicrobiae bacterium]